VDSFSKENKGEGGSSKEDTGGKGENKKLLRMKRRISERKGKL